MPRRCNPTCRNKKTNTQAQAPRASTLLLDQVDHPPANSRPAQAAN
ncbi:hypothetical protein Pcinc_032978, partial [Petrolisthes cinctipes]